MFVVKINQMKSEPLIHFALRTDQETVDALQKLADGSDRKLRSVANKALKEGVKILKKNKSLLNG